MSDFQLKISQIRQLLQERGLTAAVIRRNPNLAWLIAGRAHVPTTIDMACFDLVITPSNVFAVTNAIEAPRLKAEEFPTELEIKVVNWWEGRDPLLPTGAETGSDQPGGGRSDISAEIERLRQSLTATDIERYRHLCIDAATALGEALKGVNSSDREIDVAGAITQRLWQRDLDIAFLGVAGEERVKKYRHPLPTSSLVGNRVVASICARRKGLIASVTRIVTFGQLSSVEESEYLDLLHVEAAILDATLVGKTFAEPLQAAISAYPAHNFDGDEWQRHHQGGPTGFLPRDWPATPTSSALIAENQAIAWNPTGKGWKVEDTVLAHGSGIEILTIDSSWPSLSIGGRARPDLLRR